jgi:phenylacetate-coenzyme A ligase PaaK-like adenylate-forming protein
MTNIALNIRYPGFSSVELEALIANSTKPREERLNEVIAHAFKHVPFYIRYSQETGIGYNDIQVRRLLPAHT